LKERQLLQAFMKDLPLQSVTTSYPSMHPKPFTEINYASRNTEVRNAEYMEEVTHCNSPVNHNPKQNSQTPKQNCGCGAWGGKLPRHRRGCAWPESGCNRVCP